MGLRGPKAKFGELGKTKTVYMDPTNAEFLEEYAAKKGTSVSTLVNALVERWRKQLRAT